MGVYDIQYYVCMWLTIHQPCVPNINDIRDRCPVYIIIVSSIFLLQKQLHIWDLNSEETLDQVNH